MPNTLPVPGIPEAQSPSDGLPSNATVPHNLQRQVSDATHDLVGSQIDAAQGFQGARHEVTGSLAAPEVHHTVTPHTTTMHATMPAPFAAHREDTDTVHLNPKKIARETATTFASGGALGGVVGGAAALALGAPSMTAAAYAALPVAAQTAMLAGSTYLGGVLHNAVWGAKPGRLGTFGRGLISPISVPVGCIWNLFRRGK